MTAVPEASAAKGGTCVICGRSTRKDVCGLTTAWAGGTIDFRKSVMAGGVADNMSANHHSNVWPSAAAPQQS